MNSVGWIVYNAIIVLVIAGGWMFFVKANAGGW
jgi:hypothetical protein